MKRWLHRYSINHITAALQKRGPKATNPTWDTRNNFPKVAAWKQEPDSYTEDRQVRRYKIHGFVTC